MNHTTTRSRTRRAALMVLVGAAAGLLVLAVGAAGADENKTYTFEIDPMEIQGDTPTEVTFTIDNTTEQPISLNAVNIEVPTGVTVAGQSGTIKLRSLGLAPDDDPFEATFTVTAACEGEDYTVTWEVDARQANNFRGEGNIFHLVGGAPEMTVTCDEDDDEPTNGPGPTPQFTPPNGWDETVFCPGKSPCGTLTFESGNTSATLDGGNKAIALFLAIEDEYDLPCDGVDDFAAESGAVFFHVVGNQRGKSITITIQGAASDAEDYRVCFGAATPWTQADGSPAVFDGDFFWVGFLADCPDDVPGNRPPGQQDGVGRPVACVDSRADVNGNVVIVIVAPPGDPIIKIG